jgi:hypothetical protein
MNSNNRYNILYLYYSPIIPKRKTIEKYINSFRQCSNHHIYYVNVIYPNIPRILKAVDYDFIFLDPSFLFAKNSEIKIHNRKKTLWAFNAKNTPIIAFLQDEHEGVTAINQFILDFNIKIIFTVAPDPIIPVIYKAALKNGCRFYRLLTGYLDDDLIETLDRFMDRNHERTIDIGYRSKEGPPWYGELNYFKKVIAEKFKEACENYDLKIDISTKFEDTLWGDSWYDFLTKCNYMIGLEGGASIIDVDDTIISRTRKFIEEHPDSDFYEIREECFKNEDWKFVYSALSPRQLECCASKTCQILMEGEYNGILKSGEHYIELKRDFSNINEILAGLSEAERVRLTENAYRDVVASGRYTYKEMVNYVISTIEKHYGDLKIIRKKTIIYYMNHIRNHFDEFLVYCFTKILKLLKNKKNSDKLREMFNFAAKH